MLLDLDEWVILDNDSQTTSFYSRDFLSTTLVHEKVQLIPFLKGALMIKR